MKRPTTLLRTLLVLPIIDFAGSYSGTVTTLTGTPLAGVAISSKGATTSSSLVGQWSLSGGSSRISGQTVHPLPVSRNLVSENGHLVLSLKGVDVQGSPINYRSVGNMPTERGAARRTSVSDTDTIIVQWNGKHLVRLPMTKDSTNIVFAIDTAWDDDGGIGWNPYINYGSQMDSNDGQVYRTVAIGNQVWLAQNMKRAVDSSWCYENAQDSCLKYGRLYKWAAAMGLSDSCNSVSCSTQVASKQQGICPNGWHVPSDGEWTRLTDTIFDSSSSGPKLMSSSGWTYYGPGPGNGDNIKATDNYGFRILPGGTGDYNELFDNVGNDATMWSSTELDLCCGAAWIRDFQDGENKVAHYSSIKSFDFLLRCLKN